jgi:cytochrome P450
MSFNVMREVKEPLQMGGYNIEKGAMLQAPMHMAHYSESVWGKEGHPADEFWAGRHIKYSETMDESGKVSRTPVYALAGRPSSFFPFGMS